MKFIKSHFSSVILVLVLSVVSVFPFFQFGFFSMHDDTQVARVFEMGKSLSDGMFPVRWVSDLGYGYGYPIFNFYSPLPYYIGGFLTFIGIDALLATKIVFLLAIIGAGISMYFLINKFFGKSAGIAAAVIYVYFPYHAVNIYVRGAISELFAYVFLPLVFLALVNIHYGKPEKTNTFQANLPSILLGAFAIAAVILSHNLSAFMMFLFLLIFIPVSLVFSKERSKRFIVYLAVLFVGFLLSAFYSVPAVFEARFTNVSSQIGGGANYSDHFVCINQLWDSPWGFGGSAKGCTDGMSFRIGKLNIIFVLLAFMFIPIWFKKIRERSFFILLTIGFFALSLFMSIEYSLPIWKTIPFSQFLQFPWRFLGPAGLFISIIIGVLVFILGKILKTPFVVLSYISIILGTIFLNVKLFVPQQIISQDVNFYTNIDNLTFKTSKISDEYMPQNFIKPLSQRDIKKESVEIVSAKGTIQNIQTNTDNISFNIVINQPGTIRINRAYFPGWKVYVDGIESEYVVKNDGIYTEVLQGSHIVGVKLVQTAIEKFSNVLSFIGLIIVFIVIILDNRLYGYTRKAS